MLKFLGCDLARAASDMRILGVGKEGVDCARLSTVQASINAFVDWAVRA